MKTETTENNALRHRIQRLQDDNNQLQRLNYLQAVTIDQLHEIIDRWGLQQIVDRWQAERELLTFTRSQNN